MPLKVSRRKDTGTLWITGTVRPSGSEEGFRVRKRAGSDDEALAREEAILIEREIVRNFHLGERPLVRDFASAATSYIQAAPRSKQTVQITLKLVRYFGDTSLRQINQAAVDKAKAVILKPNAAPGTVRRNLIVPLRAILMHSNRRGWCDTPHFEMPREPRGRTAFLTPEAFEAIHAAAPARMQPLLLFLVCTGCRLGEALALRWEQTDLQGARIRLWADQTKGNKERLVELPPAAVAALAALPGPRTGHVFRSRFRGVDGELLPYRQSDGNGGGQIKNGLHSTCRRAGVPLISAHIFRHTWASWYYAITPDPFALQRAGGWSSVGLVERYTHLIPRGNEEGIRRVWGLDGLSVIEQNRVA